MTARRRLEDNTIEPALDVRPAYIPGSNRPNLFVVTDPDPFRNHSRLGVIALKKSGAGKLSEMELLATSTRLSDDPHSLGEAIQGLMEEQRVDAVTVATNVSDEVLREAGATALPEDVVEFRLTA